MSRGNFLLHMRPSLMSAARRAAKTEGVDFNLFVHVALAERVSEWRTVEWFRRVAQRGDLKKLLRWLNRPGAKVPRLSRRASDSARVKQGRNESTATVARNCKADPQGLKPALCCPVYGPTEIAPSGLRFTT